jgi:hypothetical protein
VFDVDDLAHAHEIEAASIVSHAAVTAADLAHAHEIESPAITNHAVTTATDLAHAHSIESVVIAFDDGGGGEEVETMLEAVVAELVTVSPVEAVAL